MKTQLARVLVRVADKLDRAFTFLSPETLRSYADTLAADRIGEMKAIAEEQGHYLDVCSAPEGRRFYLSGPWVENYRNCVDEVPKDLASCPENTKRTITSLVESCHERVRRIIRDVEAYALPGDFVDYWESPRQVNFFATSGASEALFNRVMENKYDVVFDTRIVPRFDYGRNTRKGFFEKLGSGEYRLTKSAPPPILKDGERCRVLVLCQTEEDLKPFIKSWFGYSSPYWRLQTFKEKAA